jgi:hypothetical protein
MVVLIQQYYISEHKQRQDEINRCLLMNSNNPLIEKIYLLNEKIYDFSSEEIGFKTTTSDKIVLKEENDLNSLYTKNLWFKLVVDKIEQIDIGKRLTYKDAFQFAKTLNKDTVKILCNNDITFDHIPSLRLIERYNYDNLCITLTRWNVKSYKPFDARLFDAAYSQDAWIFKDVEPTDEMDFYLGVIRCDNKILWLLREMGYKTLNPAKDIQTYHHHMSNFRRVQTPLDFHKASSIKTDHVCLGDLIPEN